MPSTKAGWRSPAVPGDLKTAYFTVAQRESCAGLPADKRIVARSKAESAPHSPKAGARTIFGATAAAPMANEVCCRARRRLIIDLFGFILFLAATNNCG